MVKYVSSALLQKFTDVQWRNEDANPEKEKGLRLKMTFPFIKL